MSIENILKRIDKETESSVREIQEKAEAEAARIKDEYSEKVGRLKEELKRKAKSRAAEEERRLVVSEQLELRKIILYKKREILGELYEEACGRVGSLPEGEYLELLRALILRNAISGKEEIIVPGGQKELFTPSFVGSLDEAFPGGGGFSLVKENGEFAWGVVLREERRVVDLTLGVLFEQLKENVEPEIAALLFPRE